ncbi:MAG: hypothetical protein CUN55_04385 [Phototrophicales bacterium]|nr:MAG: hypothetical protein CUN55_04385 [Phototrophicales bacterium]
MFLRPASIVPALLSIAMLISLLFTSISIATFAQGDSTPTIAVDEWYLETDVEWNNPYPRPNTIVGDAIWTVEAATFTSQYPSGFEFSVRVHNDTAPITLASVIWSHTPNELQRIETQNISADGQVRIRYRVEGVLPPWVAVNYYWSFVDAEGNRYRTNWFVGAEYLPNNPESWTRAESEDVIVVAQNTLPDDAIANTLDAMHQQRETFLQAWGALLPYKPRVILFGDQRAFNEWLGSTNSSILGLTEPEWGATIQVLNPDDTLADLTYGTVPHEIAHLYQFEFVGDRGFPAGSWFTEGNATLFELSQMYDYETRIRNIALEGNLPPLLENESFFAMSFGPDNRGRYGYDVGYTFWRWFIQEYGLSGHYQLITKLKEGETRNQALEQITGLSLYEIETRWAQWLGAESAAPPLIVPSTEYRFPPTATPFPSPR